jgi:spore germination protein YaaH
VLPRFDCQSGPTLNNLLNNPAVRAATIDGLVALIGRYGYDGINLDFESGYATDRDALTAFTAALAARLHPLGKKITLEASPKQSETFSGRSGFFDYADLANVADHVFVMNWGYHWSLSGPGAPDDLWYASRTANYVASMAARRKFVLGAPMYGMDWSDVSGARATALEYNEIKALIARVGASPVYNASADSWHFNYSEGGVGHEVWYADAATVSTRIRLAADRGIGIGFWRLGTEDQRIWSDSRLAPGFSWPD